MEQAGIRRTYYNSDGQVIKPEEYNDYKGQWYIKTKKGKLSPICGGKRYNNALGERCCKYAGKGTDHHGVGRCKQHGGCAKGSGKNNTNAVTHGIYANIWLDKLEDNERQYYGENIDKIKEIDNEIKLTNIRISRQLDKLNTYEKERMLFALKDNMTRNESFRLEQLEEYCDKLEESLTKLQLTVAKLVETKHKLEMETNIETDENKKNIETIVNAVNNIKNPFDIGVDKDEETKQ